MKQVWRTGGKGQETREEESGNGMKKEGQRKRKEGEIEGKSRGGKGKGDEGIGDGKGGGGRDIKEWRDGREGWWKVPDKGQKVDEVIPQEVFF